MKSMKVSMPILLLGLVTLLTGVSAAQNGRLSMDGPLNLQNPCNSVIVHVTGTANVIYHQNGSHEAAHYRFSGTGTDDSGNAFQVTLEAELQYDATTSSAAQVFFFPYHSVWVGHGAPSFSATGLVGILVQNGAPTNEAVVTATTSCTN